MSISLSKDVGVKKKKEGENKVIKNKASVPAAEIAALTNLYHENVYSVLGLHEVAKNEFAVRVFIPDADAVGVMAYDESKVLVKLEKVDDKGFFVGIVKAKERFAYKLQVSFGGHEVIQEDPYRFHTHLCDRDLYLLGEGTNERLYKWLGAHVKTLEGVEGVLYSVWAPNAKRVSVVGDFNFWDGRRHLMRKRIPSGVWEIFIPDVKPGAHYKYEILGCDNNLLPHKADPMGFAAEIPPQTASKVVDECSYKWGDAGWLKHRAEHGHRNQAVSIYEVHLGSWKRKPEDGNRFLTYQELADELIPYVQSMGFTHIQLMPVSEFPFDGSWGYQPVGLFAPTSRFGSPDDFKYFIDKCHQSNLGVLIDWVPGHFPSDGHGLSSFDGSPLYEHEDPRQGFHPDWNTYIYNYGRKEVANFLFSNALFWFDQYHIDGLRVDAVASMLYLDYSREEGEWIPNEYGGRENLDAINLIKRVNEKVHEYYPDAMMVAEESTAWPGVSHPTFAGGLGFGYKWNMGWMNDSLRYMSNDPVHRSYHHHEMTFSLLYAFNENFILPLSHDEVVHGKGSLLDKMPGDGWQKFANLRAYFTFMWTHPGKKLLFMGGEFAQGKEWDHDSSLDWHLLDIDLHAGVKHLIGDLNRVYAETPALYRDDLDSQCFEWIDADNKDASIFAFLRKGDANDKPVIVVSNMTPVVRESYRVGVPEAGYYVEKINTDAEIYGGSEVGNAGGAQSEMIGAHGRPQSLNIVLPPLSTVVFQKQ